MFFRLLLILFFVAEAGIVLSFLNCSYILSKNEPGALIKTRVTQNHSSWDGKR